MEILYWKVKSNFGDELNPWLWPRLISKEFLEKNEDTVFVAIGTLLNHRLNNKINKRVGTKKVIIFGSGVGYGEVPILNDSYRIFFVRGPLSSKALGLGGVKYITDPAILLKLFESNIQNKKEKKYKVSFIPHISTYEWGCWEDVCSFANINCINPSQGVEGVISEIMSSDLVLADAMHGAILADTFRIPWIATHSSYGHINSFKWKDWTESLSISYQPFFIDTVWRGDKHKPIKHQIKNIIKRNLLKTNVWRSDWSYPDNLKNSQEQIDLTGNQLIKISKECNPILSDEHIFNEKLNQCIEMLDILKNELS